MTSPFRPRPQVDPPATPGYWAVLDSWVTWGDPETRIELLTDVPVSLFANVTREPPTPLARYRNLRGIRERTGTFWAAKTGVWVPQSEPGDSLIHTWYVLQWPPGANLWWWVDGYQNRRPTVSSSILFGSLKPPLQQTTQTPFLASASIGPGLRFNYAAIITGVPTIVTAP